MEVVTTSRLDARRRATASRPSQRPQRTQRPRRTLNEGALMSDGLFDPVDPEVERIARRVIGRAIAVHRVLGPGYKEPIYVGALCLELDARGLKFERERVVLVKYNDREVGRHRLDLLIEGVVIVECKVAECLKKVHTRQVTSYLKATKLRIGYLFNFNVDLLTNGGIKRVIL